MNNLRIDSLNRLLRDYLGGKLDLPLYKWMHSRDRDLFCPMGRLDSTDPKASYEMVPQVWDERWTLAMWQAPPSRLEWEAQFKGQVPYPAQGYYVAVDTACDWILEQGYEPNERITQYVINLRRKELAMKEQGILESFQNATQRRAKEKEAAADDFLTNKWTAFSNVPGKRGGHVSFGGIG